MNIVKAKKEELRARKLLKRSNVGIKKKNNKTSKSKVEEKQRDRNGGGETNK